MKKVICVLCLMCGILSLRAQGTLLEGEVYTLQGDTLQGYVNYLSDKLMSLRCEFRTQEDSAPVVYLPSQVAGYRLKDLNLCYVPKIVPREVEEQNMIINLRDTLFVEVLVKGKLSLYATANTKLGRRFVVENQEGEIEVFQFHELLTTADVDVIKENRRRERLGMMRMLVGCDKAIEKLWYADNENDLIKTICTYNKEMAPEQVCEVAISKKNNVKQYSRLHLSLQAGMSFAKIKPEIFSQAVHHDKSSSGGPMLALGADFTITPTYPGWLLQSILGWECASIHVKNNQNDYHVMASRLSLLIGPAYEWSETGSTYINLHGGFNSVLHGINDEKYENQNEQLPYQLSSELLLGYYFGLGFRIPLEKGSFLFSVDYSRGKGGGFHLVEKTFTSRIGYQF